MINKSTEPKNIRIALDAMGGDFAPNNEIQGAIEAYKEKKTDINLEIIFVGNETQIRSVLAQYDYGDMKYTILHASEVVTMDDDPTEALKKKKDSSLYKGFEYHSSGYCDAFVSAGNTGAMLSHATVLLGRVKGVSRPTIGTFIPTHNSYPSLLLDAGANTDSKPRYLYEFAVMGSIYSSQILGLERPKVGLLNIGEELSKGNEVAKQAYQLLKSSELNFIGNIEGGDVLLGSADIVVCDGFTGNILLKFAESIPGFLKYKFKAYASKDLFHKLVIAAFKPVLKNVFQGFDYQEHGGVPMLGVNGVAIIGHGKSTPKALKNMINRAIEMIQKELNTKIEAALNQSIISEIN